MIKKVRTHISQNEPLLFERSSPGKKGYQLPDLDVPAVDAEEALGAENTRAEIEDFPEVSEVDVIRHFTRLSTWNYAIDLGCYPLGSCTMKYNPRVNEVVARTNGRSAGEINQGLLGRKIVGGLPLDRYYPELKGSVLMCCTEMVKREQMDQVAEAWA